MCVYIQSLKVTARGGRKNDSCRSQFLGFFSLCFQVSKAEGLIVIFFSMMVLAADVSYHFYVNVPYIWYSARMFVFASVYFFWRATRVLLIYVCKCVYASSEWIQGRDLTLGCPRVRPIVKASQYFSFFREHEHFRNSRSLTAHLYFDDSLQNGPQCLPSLPPAHKYTKSRIHSQRTKLG